MLDQHDATVHEQLRDDLKRWRSLTLIGTQPCLDPTIVVELRNCTCGSTLGRRVKRTGPGTVRRAP